MPEIGSLFVRIGARIDEFEAGMRKVQDRLKQAEQRFEGMRAVGQRFTAAGAKMAAAGAAMGAGLGLAVKTAADFESAMSRVGALSGATGKEFSKLRETAQKLGETTAFSASQAAEGMQFLAMAGYDTNEIIAAMPGLLNAAAAGQVDLGTTADITSNILSGFGLAASETARVADVLTKTFTSSNTTMEMLGITMKYVAPLAKSAGVSLEETAAAAGILGNAGIQADQAGTALRGMILRLIDPPKEAADALAQLGVKTTDASGKMLPLADIIAQVKQATEGMTEAQKTAIATQISGTYAASGFLALLDAGPDALRSFTGELENAGGTADRIAKEQLNNLNGQLTILKSGLEGMAISIGTTLTPYISKLASLVQGLVDRFNNLPGPIKQGIAIFAALGAIILVVGGGILIFAGMIMQGVAAIGTIITAVGGLSGALAFITGSVGIVVAAIAGAIAAGVLLYKNWDKVKYYGMQAWGKLKKFILDRISEMLQGIQKFAGVIPGLKDRIAGAIAKVQALSQKETIILDARKVAFEAASVESAASKVQTAVDETKQKMASLQNIQELTTLAQANDEVSLSAGKVAKAAEEVKAKWEMANETLSLSLQIVQARLDALSNKLSENKDRVILLAEKAKNLSEQMQIQQQIVENLKQAHEAAAKAKGADAKETRELELKLVQAEAALAGMEKQMRETKRAISEQAQQFRNLATEVENVRKKYETDMAAALEDYQRKAEQVNERLIAEERRVREEYQRSLDQRTKSLTDWVGLFDEVTKKEVAGKTLLQNLKDQVLAFKNWGANIQELAARGVDQGLIAQLKEMGPKAGPQIAALNKLTDDELREYVNLWREKNLLARQEALSQLEQQRWEMQQKLLEIRSNAAQQLETYRAEWARKQAEIRKNAEEELTRIEKRFKEMEVAGTKYGSNLMGNFIGGIQGRMSQLQSVLENMAMMVDSYMPHSPARIGPLSRMDEWGPGLVDTFIKGIRAGLPAVERAVSRTAGAFAPSSGYMPAVAGAGNTTNTTFITNTFHITVSGNTTGEQAEDFLRELARRGVKF